MDLLLYFITLLKIFFVLQVPFVFLLLELAFLTKPCFCLDILARNYGIFSQNLYLTDALLTKFQYYLLA
jgi:hypothetical protein